MLVAFAVPRQGECARDRLSQFSYQFAVLGAATRPGRCLARRVDDPGPSEPSGVAVAARRRDPLDLV
jgi:hypothetical protein